MFNLENRLSGIFYFIYSGSFMKGWKESNFTNLYLELFKMDYRKSFILSDPKTELWYSVGWIGIE